MSILQAQVKIEEISQVEYRTVPGADLIYWRNFYMARSKARMKISVSYYV